MNVRIKPRRFSGTIRVPPSKSHTIRRLLIAALAEGDSEITVPLDSLDTRSCVSVCRGLGAQVEEYRGFDPACPNPADREGKKLLCWKIRGNGGFTAPAPAGPVSLNVGNSGTTLYLALAAASLGTVPVEFDGDEQIRHRSAAPLLEALSGLGVLAESKGRGGCAPILIRGPWKGGRVSLPCPTSQYLSALLIAAPLAPAGTLAEIEVPLLNERPYIDMTLSCLKAQGISWEAGDYSRFLIPGGASYKPMNGPVAGDFSSAAFPAAAAAVSGGELRLLGLDPEDSQGDKVFFTILEEMGCRIGWERLGSPGASKPEWALDISRTGALRGGVFDLNAAPDLLPVLAVTGAFAAGETELVNAAHARIKETDRIAVMAEELGKLGIFAEERPDGLSVRGKGGSGLGGGAVNGRGDHRIVMAFAAGALGAAGAVEIEGAEAAAVTYPGFLELLDSSFL